MYKITALNSWVWRSNKWTHGGKPTIYAFKAEAAAALNAATTSGFNTLIPAGFADSIVLNSLD